MHARASGEATRHAKRGRQPICVSSVLLDGLQKKVRLLVVYILESTFITTPIIYLRIFRVLRWLLSVDNA